jgi:uncharacterized SAM-binding protein YcdF (DUF218 family)
MFVLSKLAGVLIQPGNMVLMALLAGLLLLFTRRERLGRLVLVGLAGALILVAVVPWAGLLIAPLEQRFPFPASLPAKVDGIVVLGGGIDPDISAARGRPSLNGAAERVTAMIELARRYPDARMVYSGGSGSVTAQELKEAPVARDFLTAQGMDVSRIIFEAQSRNTRENATLSKALAMPQPDETWLLVTSASHMPRAMGAFRAVGWQMVPYPVNYVTTGRLGELRFNVQGGFAAIGGAVHEWMGLVYYRWRGWSDGLFPSP